MTQQTSWIRMGSLSWFMKATPGRCASRDHLAFTTHQASTSYENDDEYEPSSE